MRAAPAVCHEGDRDIWPEHTRGKCTGGRCIVLERIDKDHRALDA